MSLTNTTALQNKIVYNAYRFNASNSVRSNIAGLNGGQMVGGAYGFNCSGYVAYVFSKSGYAVPTFWTGAVMPKKDGLTDSGANWQKAIDPGEVKSGDLVYFSGHVGIVESWNPESKTGTYRSSTTSKGVITDAFSTDPKAGLYWGGGDKKFLGFTHVTSDYDASKDVWRNDAASGVPALANAPVLSTKSPTSWWNDLATFEAKPEC